MRQLRILTSCALRCQRVFRLLMLCVLLLVQARAEHWQPIAESVDLLEHRFAEFDFLGAPLVALRVVPAAFTFSVATAREFGSDRMRVADLRERSQALIAINSNFFGRDDRALGLVIRSGQNLNPLHLGGRTLTGVFAFIDQRPHIFGRSELPKQSMALAVQAGPRLLIKRQVVTGLATQVAVSRRAGVCIDAQGRVILFSSREGFGSGTLQQFAKLLVAEPFNCVDALNFDGGGSAQLSISASLPKAKRDWQGLQIDGDAVPVALIVKRK